MAINFNALPQEQPSAFVVVPTGLYATKITKADMKQGKDTTKPPYLNVQLDILNEVGEKLTTMWETFTESSEGLMGYKIRRICEAVDLQLSGEVELQDIGKMLVDKELRVFVTIDTWENKERNVVDIKQDGIFLSKSNGSQNVTPDTSSVDDLDIPTAEPRAETPQPEASKVQY